MAEDSRQCAAYSGRRQQTVGSIQRQKTADSGQRQKTAAMPCHERRGGDGLQQQMDHGAGVNDLSSSTVAAASVREAAPPAGRYSYLQIGGAARLAAPPPPPPRHLCRSSMRFHGACCALSDRCAQPLLVLSRAARGDSERRQAAWGGFLSRPEWRGEDGYRWIDTTRGELALNRR